jgi:hypothetical protein
MQIATAFDLFQTEVNADPTAVKEGRRRRDLFCDAFNPLDEVVRAIPSGALARRTQLDPIHDVDLIIEFVPTEHPDWGTPGRSADDALTHVAGVVTDLLGVSSGAVAREVRRTLKRNHVVRCFLDDPDDPEIEYPFAVEVAPALRQADGTLLLPERYSSRWITADPEDLIRRVGARQEAWSQFVPLVRVVKSWKNTRRLDAKSLVMEVLALRCLPVDDRPRALARFFTAAASDVMGGVFDPAGHCGEIQPDLDRSHLRERLLAAGDLASRALAAEAAGDLDRAVCLWRQLFGPTFPEPPSGCPDRSASAIGDHTATLTGAAVGAPRRRIRDIPQG